MTTSLQRLPATELHETAKAIARRKESHWSRLAIILGRINSERLYETLGDQGGYGSTRAYAEQELDIHFEEFNTLMALARLMHETRGVISEARWLEVPKTHALLIRRVKSLGGNVVEWLEKAKVCGTAAALRKEIALFLKQEPWTTFSATMPVSLLEQVNEALRLALPEATGEPSPDPGMIEARGTRFRCLEVITRHFTQTYRADAERSGAFTKDHTAALVLLLDAYNTLCAVGRDQEDAIARTRTTVFKYLSHVGLSPNEAATMEWLTSVGVAP